MFKLYVFLTSIPALYTPARNVVLDLYRKSPRVLQKKAIEIITGVLNAMNHLRENNVALSDLVNQMSGIQYDGRRIILNVDLPKYQPRSTVTSSVLPTNPFKHKRDTPQRCWTVTDEGVLEFDSEWFGQFVEQYLDEIANWMDIPEQENKILQELFGLPAHPWPNDCDTAEAIPSAIRPIWQYLMGCEVGRRLHDLRNISEQLCGGRDRVFDISPALVATGNLPYLDCPYTKSDGAVGLGTVACLTKRGRLVVVCDILGKLRDEEIINMDQFISTEIDDDDEGQASPSEELIRAGSSGIFPAFMGDYTRYAR
ncbi:hypothetical protein C8R44DRAFT_326377 [Mycena epipterygia]|nr:hypothetical protein C8R44DRAFT_326377 [Mycena epipterygia]